jgi:hypothetical protein
VYADGQIATVHQSPAVWQKNGKVQVFKLAADKIIKSVQLDGGIFMDYTPKDNWWKG